MNIFPPDSPAAFSLANYKALVNASLLAYGDPAGKALDLQYIRAALVNGGIEGQVITDSFTKTLVFIAKTTKQIVIAFQGTKNRQEFVTDLEAWMVSRNLIYGPVYMVHGGFNNALNSVWMEILTTVKKLRDNGQEIWITGHSLGGALAKLCALRFYENSIPVTGVYTFGQPRCFNWAGAKLYDRVLGDVSFRVRDKADGIPMVPLATAGYLHSETLIYFDVTGKMHVDPPMWLMIRSDLANICMEWKLGHKVAGLNDHSCQNYINLVP